MNPLIADARAALDPVVLFRAAFTLEPLPWQTEYLRESRNILTLKGRQVGASLAASLLCVHKAIYFAGSTSIILSPTQRQSEEILTHAREGLRALDSRLAQDSMTALRLNNGARIISLPGTAPSARGYHCELLVLDECAYLAEETIVAARALIATGGRLLIQSTPAATHGTFYDLVQANDPSWAHFRVRSDEVSTISAEWLEGERKAMTPDAFAGEYMTEFGKAGPPPIFNLDRLRSLVDK